MPERRTLVSISLCLCALLLGPAIHAEEAHRTDASERTVADENVSPDRSTETHPEPSRQSQLRSLTVAEDPSLNESIRGLEVVVHADGSRSVDLEDHFSNILVLDLREQSGAVMCTTDLVSVLRKITAARDAEGNGE